MKSRTILRWVKPYQAFGYIFLKNKGSMRLEHWGLMIVSSSLCLKHGITARAWSREQNFKLTPYRIGRWVIFTRWTSWRRNSGSILRRSTGDCGRRGSPPTRWEGPGGLRRRIWNGWGSNFLEEGFQGYGLEIIVLRVAVWFRLWCSYLVPGVKAFW